MVGAGAYLLRFIGAVIRWIFSGFTKNFKDIFEGPEDDLEKSFMNDLLNIFIAVLFLALVVAIIQIIFF